MNNVDLTRYKRIVQYFWDPELKNNDDLKSSIWCLGIEYPPVSREQDRTSPSQLTSSPGTLPANTADISSRAAETEDSAVLVSQDEAQDHGLGDRAPSLNQSDGGWPIDFLEDFESKIWMTYRSGFVPIPKSQDPGAASSMTLAVRLRSQLSDASGFTSDTGWGCMIRSGQSLLANTLLQLRLGRAWRLRSGQDGERDIISLFADDPKAPFSIHNFVQHGASVCGKHPGEWFGPSATARCIQDLTADYPQAGIRVYVTSDSSDVFEDRFMSIARADDGSFRPTLVLLGIRLGIDRVTPVYWEALKAALQCPQSVGVAGGRPSASHYFVGVQGSYFFYLDPHETRPCQPTPGVLTADDLQTYHTRRLRRLHIKDMDPSMLMGFLIRSEQDWQDWKRSAMEVQGKPIIHVFDSEPAPHGGFEREGALDEVETLSDDE